MVVQFFTAHVWALKALTLHMSTHVQRPDMEVGHRVNGSFGSSFTSGSQGHHFDPVWDREFFQFSKKCPKYKTYIWNAEMTKVIVRCLFLDWNHWLSVHAMNFFFYLWLLKILWPENTSYMSRHLEFIIVQGQLGLWVAGFPGHWVIKCDAVPSLTETTLPVHL